MQFIYCFIVLSLVPFSLAQFNCSTTKDCPLILPVCDSGSCAPCSTDEHCISKTSFSFAMCTEGFCAGRTDSLTIVGLPSYSSLGAIISYGLILIGLIVFIAVALFKQASTGLANSYGSTKNTTDSSKKSDV